MVVVACLRKDKDGKDKMAIGISNINSMENAACICILSGRNYCAYCWMVYSGIDTGIRL